MSEELRLSPEVEIVVVPNVIYTIKNKDRERSLSIDREMDEDTYKIQLSHKHTIFAEKEVMLSELESALKEMFRNNNISETDAERVAKDYNMRVSESLIL